ncbi:MAG TPA: FliA/WhiG family RNA polymerase sigma factor [Terriglobia bacterium]|nr:FliA/WhiG family RNA polymerase sigma factor [Terriglobia bacterium]
MATHQVTPSGLIPPSTLRVRRQAPWPATGRRTSSTTYRARRVAADEQKARECEQVCAKLLSLVKRVAYEMREHLPAHVEVDDLVGAGTLGLLDAVRKFDARKHVKIETYARHRIRGAILDGLRSLDTASRDMRQKNKRAEKTFRELETRLGRSANDAEMAQALGISLKKWYETVQELQGMGVDWLRPMQAVELKEPDPETLAAREEVNQFDLCYQEEQKEMLDRALGRVSERERTIISLYYEQDMTMKQIGDELGIDESRVSQIHSAALAHLRTKVQSLLRPARPSAPPSCLVGGQQARAVERLF